MPDLVIISTYDFIFSFKVYDLVERTEEPVPDPRRRSGAKRSRGEDASPRKGDTGAVDPTITVGPGTVLVTCIFFIKLDSTGISTPD